MKTLLLALLLAVPVFAQYDPRIAEGIALHEAGKYDEAIEKYKAVLADSPGDKLAIYEMAFAYQMKGDAAKCRDVLEPIVNERDPKLQPHILTVYGNCLDILGESRKAIAAYRKGLKNAPNEPQLLYNLAIALIGQKQLGEARELLKKELVLRPGHASGHFALAQVFEAEGFRGPAILSYLRVLAIDFQNSQRRGEAAKRLVDLLNLGVEEKKKGEINITVDPKPRTEEGDFGAWQTMLALASAARFTEENEKLSEFERVRVALSVALAMLLEAPPKGRAYSIQHNIPFFAELEKQELLQVFTGIAIAPLGLAGSEEWGQQNQEAIGRYARWLEGLAR